MASGISLTTGVCFNTRFEQTEHKKY